MIANEQIRFKEVRVIGPDGKQMGIMSSRNAVQMAKDMGYDLVLVAPNAKPPVCRIMDLGKYKYELKKKAKEAKKKQRVILVKELRLRPKIEEHDYQVKLKHAREFLSDGNKVKVVMRYRGREMSFIDSGKEVLERFAQDVADIGVVEKKPELEGRQMIMVLAPKH
ncbi:MAG: translation initiation factor IF-3 [Deferribacteres bacterium]|nr:translation initiation factor IF-3 [Deferribacteres bacterium]